LCVIFSGFNGPAFAFRWGGSGDITTSARLWQTEPHPQNIGSGVAINDRVFIANAGPNTIRCVVPETGEILWDERGGAAHWGSIVAAAGRLYVTNQKGDTLVFAPDPERLTQLAVNSLGEPSHSTPAISDGEIFLRTTEALYCVSDADAD
jgi:outer membrane protein assembly factor BamB